MFLNGFHIPAKDPTGSGTAVNIVAPHPFFPWRIEDRLPLSNLRETWLSPDYAAMDMLFRYAWNPVA